MRKRSQTAVTPQPSMPPPATGVASAEQVPDFKLIGPRNVANRSWWDLMSSSWTNPAYRRIAMSCFVEAAYLLELDRQDKRTAETALAPSWWKPFKYKQQRILYDPRDNSIYGVLLEWDQIAALSDLIFVRPNGAPKAILALRGTILKGPTAARDLEDDFRFFAVENLKGSVRFTGALESLRSMIEKHGHTSVCIAGHSLGASLALQVGKTLAKDGICVECHLFNPPSASLATGLRKIKEKALHVWGKHGRAPAGSSSSHHHESDSESLNGTGSADSSSRAGSAAATEEKMVSEVKQWVPNLYINNSDYICCHYEDQSGIATVTAEKPVSHKAHEHQNVAAKLFVIAKGPKQFLEAHGLQQWWLDDSELQVAAYDQKILYRQLKSLYVRDV